MQSDRGSDTPSLLKIITKAWNACTWGDTRETPETWLAIVQGNDIQQKKRLFNKLFFELVGYDIITQLFDKDFIKSCLETMNRPLPRPHLEKRRKVWRYLFLDIREPIKELDWVIRYGDGTV
ncbi:hypothetical protein C5O22_09125 [Treponema sp. J25]|nr:hypothetical protein C5O22_09125 [Treponema sp. J25]